MKHSCGKTHYEKHKSKKIEFKGNLTATGGLPLDTEITKIELYSSYLGKVPIKAKVINDNIYMESIYTTINNKKIYIKIIDYESNNLNDTFIYPSQQLIKLDSVCINKDINLYNYILTLMCYRKINEYEQSTENINKYTKLISEVITPSLENKINKEYPCFNLAMPISSIKKLLQEITKYNSRIDILFSCLEYLEFISKITYGKIDTINNQDVLIFISGVPKLDNAYWNGSYMVFGSGDVEFYPLTSIDVIGHELTHGLIQGLCDLEYKGHSGALNESYADILGVMLEFYVYDKYKNKLLGKQDWTIGEDLTMYSDCLRSMSDPHLHEQPKKMYDKYYMDPTTMIDYGGVHINSGIPNHCFYLLSQKIDKFLSLDMFIKCMFKLFKHSDFFEFSSTLENVSEYNNKQLIQESLLKVGLPYDRYNNSFPNKHPVPYPVPQYPNQYPNQYPVPQYPNQYPNQYPVPYPQYPVPYPQYPSPYPQYPVPYPYPYPVNLPPAPYPVNLPPAPYPVNLPPAPYPVNLPPAPYPPYSVPYPYTYPAPYPVNLPPVANSVPPQYNNECSFRN
jgi:hypothetical protein